jgi:hypothetical protein
MKDSNILLSVGVRDIGLRSLLTSVGGLNLGIVMTFADFHIVGIVDCDMDELKMKQIGSASAKAKSLSNQLGMLSGPVDLWMLIRDSL